jgi:hypothetical protein
MGKVFHDRADYVARARLLGLLLADGAEETERNRELPAPIVAALRLIASNTCSAAVTTGRGATSLIRPIRAYILTRSATSSFW